MYIVDALCNVHSHLREGLSLMRDLVRWANVGGADTLLPMPNTEKGLLTAEEVWIYYKDLCVADAGTRYIQTVMLNEESTFRTIDDCTNRGVVDTKLYPLDRTTKSHNGIRHYGRMLNLVKYCGKMRVKVHVHPEHPNMLFDNRDAEYAFLSIVEMFLQETDATIIWEHGTDARSIPFWKDFAKTGRFYLTLTAHHLVTSEDESFGDVRAVCKPPVKTRRDREDLAWLVTENHHWVMAGLDDAPHDRSKKHGMGNCACGAYTAPFGLQLYAHALDALLQTPGGPEIFTFFTSRNARELHGLPPASHQYRLVREPFLIPPTYQAGDWVIEPFWAGRELRYSLEEV